MNYVNSLTPENPVVALVRRIDAVCRRFEDNWRNGQGLRIEDYLDEPSGPGHAALLVEVIALEQELRAARGDEPTTAEYLERFPGQEGPIAAAFEGLNRPAGQAAGHELSALTPAVRAEASTLPPSGEPAQVELEIPMPINAPALTVMVAVETASGRPLRRPRLRG